MDGNEFVFSIDSKPVKVISTATHDPLSINTVKRLKGVLEYEGKPKDITFQITIS